MHAQYAYCASMRVIRLPTQQHRKHTCIHTYIHIIHVNTRRCRCHRRHSSLRMLPRPGKRRWPNPPLPRSTEPSCIYQRGRRVPIIANEHRQQAGLRRLIGTPVSGMGVLSKCTAVGEGQPVGFVCCEWLFGERQEHSAGAHGREIPACAARSM
jgi:hypothetical protein